MPILDDDKTAGQIMAMLGGLAAFGLGVLWLITKAVSCIDGAAK